MFNWLFGGGGEQERPRVWAGKFTFGEDVRRALSSAREQALNLGSARLDTEHLLLGLLGDHGQAARRLATMGIDAAQLLDHVVDSIPRPRGDTLVLSELPYTSAAKTVLELTIDEARLTKTAEVTQGHLLIALLREGKGRAAQALAAFGVTLAELRDGWSGPGAAFGITIDDASDRSIYEQIVAQVQEAAATGRAKPGDRLPSVRALADELDVAPGTVARAYAELERLGVVITDGARGTRIAPKTEKPAAGADDLVAAFRGVVVGAYHRGATAMDLREALERAMEDIYPDDDGGVVAAVR